jgi:hypothetical protein
MTMLQATTTPPVLQVPLPPLPPQAPAPPFPEVIVSTGPEILPPWMVLPPPVLVMSLMALCTAAAVILWPLMRAIGRRIEGSGNDALRREVLELRERVRDLESGQHHVAELEERLDFAERLLAQRREAEQLPRS